MSSFVLQTPNRVYLDHNATTPLSSEVSDKIIETLPLWGNPSSIHWSGRAPKSALRSAKQKISSFLGVAPLELVFTGGGSEANNLAIKGVVESLLLQGEKLEEMEFITSVVEHPSVSKVFDFLQAKGAQVHRVPVSRGGILDMQTYESLLSEKTVLVSMMLANNETGNIFPVSKMVEKAHQVGALFHSDCVQALGKMEFHLKELGVDLATFSAHKFYALKGVGVLYQKRGIKFESLVHGGNQERGRRAGTENTLGIVALGEACGIAGNQLQERLQTMAKLLKVLEKNILEHIPDVVVNGSEGPRLPNTLSLSLRDVDGESLLMNLDLKGFSVSTGAACSSGSPEPSPVLRAMGLSHEDAQSSLRISLGWGNTEKQILDFVEILKQVVSKLRSFKSQGE